MTKAKLREVELRWRKAIEKALKMGILVVPNRAMVGLDGTGVGLNGYLKECSSGICAIGAMVLGVVGNPAHHNNFVADILGVSIYDVNAVESGFEGWKADLTDDRKELFKLGQRLREDYV